MARRPKVVWSAPALDELDEIAAWIAVDKPPAAARLIERILARTDQLSSFPHSGRRLPESPKSSYRELVETPVRLIYRVEGSAIFIVWVTRSERKLPSSLR